MSELNNKNAEKWKIEDARTLLEDALKIVKDNPDLIWIGQIAEKQDTYRQIYDYLIEKFKEETVFNTIKRQIGSILESRIVTGSINGDYNPTMVIFTLKNNFGWVDAQKVEQEITNKQPTININIDGKDVSLK
jgi:hypothetical protein